LGLAHGVLLVFYRLAADSPAPELKRQNYPNPHQLSRAHGIF
jgi:hypothetical protein